MKGKAEQLRIKERFVKRYQMEIDDLEHEIQKIGQTWLYAGDVPDNVSARLSNLKEMQDGDRAAMQKLQDELDHYCLPLLESISESLYQYVAAEYPISKKTRLIEAPMSRLNKSYYYIPSPEPQSLLDPVPTLTTRPTPIEVRFTEYATANGLTWAYIGYLPEHDIVFVGNPE